MGYSQEYVWTEAQISKRTYQRAETRGVATEKTLKSIANVLFSGDMTPFTTGELPANIRTTTDANTLRAFAESFSNHTDRQTSIVRAREYDFHTWDPHSDNIGAVTYKELDLLWANPRLYLPIEAMHFRFVESKGVCKRIFLIGDNLGDERTRTALVTAMCRHKSLGFETRAMTTHAYQSIAKVLNVRCHMFIVFKGKRVYFTQCGDDDQGRSVVMTIHEDYLKTATEVFHKLWDDAFEVDEVIKVLGLSSIKDGAEEKIEEECKLIRGLAELNQGRRTRTIVNRGRR